MDIGIDLGTTFSAIAVKGRLEMAPGYPPGDYLEEVDVTMLPSPNGNYTIPSVFWWHPDEPDTYLFGDEAKQKAEEGYSPIMFSKRSIGTTDKLLLNGREFTAKEVAARFLRHMKDWAETVTGQTVDRAVVTHPAYFKPNQTEETLQAAREAGLNMRPEQLMMEPCAAALAYTLNDTRDPLRVMTYDLGGGTFDVAVMEKIDGVIQMRKFHGDPLLGGYNFDNALVEWVLGQIRARGKNIPYDPGNEEHRGRRARLLQVAEQVKVRLSDQRTDKVPVPLQVDFLVDDQGQRVQFRGQINREQYAALIHDELQRTIECCRAALEGAGMSPSDLHAILLVGGSTRGKWVVDAVSKEFAVVGEPYHPDLCVAAGAALCAAQLPPPPAVTESVTLSLDFPSSSILPTVDISGAVSPSPGSAMTQDACRQLRVCLQTPGGVPIGPAEVGGNGSFVFSQVSLATEGSPTRFLVTVGDGAKELARMEGTIHYLEDDQDGTQPARAMAPPPIPVLPRPLFLKAERMVSMAEEGAQLPAKCQVRLRRSFGGPTLEVPIFMENEPVGTISVEDIPDEGGEGCLVVVDVEVTQSNEMRGKVLVYAPNGKTVVKEGPVRIAFPPIVIPPESELRGRFDELRDRLEMDVLHAPPQDRARLAGPGRKLIRKIDELLKQQQPDNQILHERIKELERVVNPPADDMDPPRREFEGLIAECREILAANSENSTLKAYGAQVDRVETAGKDACETKNNRKWTNANETLQKIRVNIERALGQGDKTAPPPPPPPPPAMLKAMAMRQIDGLRADLKTAREARLRDAGGERWLGHCEDYERRIDHMAAQVAKIPDDATNSDQVLAQVQSYLHPVETLRKKIDKIRLGVGIETL